MGHELRKIRYKVMRQVKIPISYDGILFEDGLRLDLLVDNLVTVQLKAVDQVNQVCETQIIGRLKMTRFSLGYLTNFNVTLIKHGIKSFRVQNNSNPNFSLCLSDKIIGL